MQAAKTHRGVRKCSVNWVVRMDDWTPDSSDLAEGELLATDCREQALDKRVP